MATAAHDYQAHCEDYESDASGEHGVAREDSMTRANVSTKRSKDLQTDRAPAPDKTMPANADVRSDSGYSSFTAASKTSADSAPSATSRSPPVAAAATPTAPAVSQSPAPRPRRPTAGEQRQHSNEGSPRQKPVSRPASVSTATKQRPSAQRRPTLSQDNRDEECTDPTCTTCGPNAAPQQRLRPDLLSTRNNPSYVSDSRSQRSAPDPYYSPPSPVYNRQPAPYASQGPAVVQPSRTRRSSSVSRPRPQSFAAPDTSAGFWPGMSNGYPSPPQERGPPPSFSAYQNIPNMQHHMQNMQNMPNMPYGAHPIPPFMGAAPQGGFYPPPPQHYDAPQPRPGLSARGPSSYGARNAPPIVTQEDPEHKKYSARYPQPPTPVEQKHSRGPSLPMAKPKLIQYGDAGVDQESESDYSEEDEQYNERHARRAREVQASRLMPPPSLKRNPSQQRPTLSHAKTSQVVERLEDSRRDQRRRSIVEPERIVHQEREREQERAARTNAASSRRASVSRPPPPRRQTQSEYNTRQARVIVNDSRSERRRSYQPTEKTYEEYVKARADDQYNAERKREKRASRVIVQERYIPGQFDDDEDEEEEEEEPARPLRPRRRAETEPRKGKERSSEIKNKANDAEEYIKSTRGSRDPYADSINKAALKRASRVPSLPSDSTSSHSNGSGKASHSNRTTMTSATNNEIRLRVDGTMPLSLQLSGDMEGRTLQLVPAEGGMTDLVIGGNVRSGETLYRSERGSIYGNANNNNRRSIVAGQGRRDAEDVSERSSRSTRSRRDRSDEICGVREERGHVLRRSRTTAYH
ncbi:hypothetical protein BDU57DRAFT_140137 [Ampelomyces quisqualis]|uniref:Uncharacterized protein n=1 Tax=Ampelomyces quisqualis TaxID=50730 RepID=A0A6A5QUL6_AMPQU|nr:hypothetical protein BDU57DRAFT_140137 [Ampelomyces quisqualis]